MLRHHGGAGFALIEPLAVNSASSLRLCASVLSPQRAYHGYLGAIFAGVLKGSWSLCVVAVVDALVLKVLSP